MIRRQGFTLIELLIVVTIIAILAGAAVPYVQDYVEQARVGRAKADLDEIKRAVMLYEVQYGPYTSNTIASLVGPFLTKNTPDPWSNPYVVNSASSTVLSWGPDGKANSGEEVSVEYRPRMAVTRAYWVDIDGDGLPSTDDQIQIKVCRPLATETGVIDDVGLSICGSKGENVAASASLNTTSNGFVMNSTMASFTLTIVDAAGLKVGSSTLKISSGNTICDKSAGPASAARSDFIPIISK